MNYFVAYAEPGALNTTSWLLLPSADISAEEGDVVFLLARVKSGSVLVGLFTIGGLGDHTAAPAIVAELSVRLPSLPIPEDLCPELRCLRADIDGRWLHPIEPRTGRALHDMSQKYLDSKYSAVVVGKRRIRVPKENSAEEQVKAIEKKARGRLGQVDFREALIESYKGRCAISGCPVDEVLSAAHILDYSLSKCQEVWNGILLRADIHLLFDRHLLRIFPGVPPVVVLGKELQASDAYTQFHLQPLRPPEPFEQKTNDELRRRWDAANRVFHHFADPRMG